MAVFLRYLTEAESFGCNNEVIAVNAVSLTIRSLYLLVDVSGIEYVKQL